MLSSLSNFIGLCCNNYAVYQIDYVLLTLIKSPKSLSIVAISLTVGLLIPAKKSPISRQTIINVVIFSIGLILFNYQAPGSESLSA